MKRLGLGDLGAGHPRSQGLTAVSAVRPWDRGWGRGGGILVPRALLTRGQPSATRGSGQIHIKLASDWPQRNIWFIVNMNKKVRWKTRSSGVGAPESESRSRSPGV